MVIFEDITTDFFSSVFFKIKDGSLCKIVTESDFTRSLIFNTILGFDMPSNGKVFLQGKDLFGISKHEAIDLFKNVGVIWRYGGLVSNLSVMENIMLPSIYHEEMNPGDIKDDIIMELFNQAGFKISCNPEYLRRQCGPMPIHEKRLISIVRTIIREPDLIIYDSVFEGYEEAIHNGLVNLLQQFHKKKAKRTSIFLYSKSEEESGRGVKTDIVIRQIGRKFIVEE